MSLVVIALKSGMRPVVCDPEVSFGIGFVTIENCMRIEELCCRCTYFCPETNLLENDINYDILLHDKYELSGKCPGYPH